MSRLLYLAFERPPHPDAVCYPATADDVLFVLEQFDREPIARIELARQLRRYLEQQEGLAPWQRPAVPCRRPAGLYALVPWRFAKWLSVVLPASEGRIEQTRRRLLRWLGECDDLCVMNVTHPSS